MNKSELLFKEMKKQILKELAQELLETNYEHPEDIMCHLYGVIGKLDKEIKGE